MNKLNVLSLFDGLGGAKIALDELGLECNYYASEIDEYAMKVSKANYPGIIQLGDVSKIRSEDLPKIDLLIGGSPCQDLSVANNNRKGLKGEKSGLFWEYVRLLKELKPKYFILENVASMKDIDKNIISATLNCEPIMINSALLTAQNRKRYYWTNIKDVSKPLDSNIFLKDIIEDMVVEKCTLCDYFLDGEQFKKVKRSKDAKAVKRNKNGFEYNFKQGTVKFPQDLDDKSQTLTTSCGTNGRGTTYIKQLCVDEKYFLSDKRMEKVKFLQNQKRIGKVGNGGQGCDIFHTLDKSVSLDTGCKGLYLVPCIDVNMYHTEKAIEYMNSEISPGRTRWDMGYNSNVKNKKSSTILANFYKGVPYNVLVDEIGRIRKLTPIECERLQSIPDNYTNHVSNTQRYKMIGNGFTISVIKYILSHTKWNTKCEEFLNKHQGATKINISNIFE